MSGPTTEDKAKDIGWNVLTGIPLVGSVASGIDAIHNVGKIIDPNESANLSNPEAEKATRAQAVRDLASDAISVIPLVGTASSIVGTGYDVMASNDTWGNLTNQMMGGKDAYPTPASEKDY
jgi:hypothetical protein